jgi:hypothetical protein
MPIDSQCCPAWSVAYALLRIVRPPRSSSETLGDAELRSLLRAKLQGELARDPTAVLIEELGLCRHEVRLDLALVNGHFHGYEIKSDKDSLRRLGHQVAVYCQVLDRATLVTGRKFLEDALEELPDWWEILTVRLGKGSGLQRVRAGRPNPARAPRRLVELLWLDAALELLERRNAAKGFRGSPRDLVWDRVCEHYNVDEIAAAVRVHLKCRTIVQSAQWSLSDGELYRDAAKLRRTRALAHLERH